MNRLNRIEEEQVKMKAEQIELKAKAERLDRLEEEQIKMKSEHLDEIVQLKKRIQQLETTAAVANAFSDGSTDEDDEGGKDAKASYMPRSCSDLKSVDPSLPSGNYLVDSDGAGIGDPAFFAYCDMTGAGETLHFYFKFR